MINTQAMQALESLLDEYAQAVRNTEVTRTANFAKFEDLKKMQVEEQKVRKLLDAAIAEATAYPSACG